MDDVLSIGRIARLTGLSVGALRHYDELACASRRGSPEASTSSIASAD